MQWFKRHPEFLRDESTGLSNDSNYKELFQWRDNLFISHGNIFIRHNQTHKFPILVVYTDATPYRLPIIFPLKRELSDDEIKRLCALKFSDAIHQIRQIVKFYYTLRHQNSSGELCTLERENLDSEERFYGITTILQRARDWFAAHITGEFPPEAEEVDFCSHFNFINREIKLLYPEHFLANTYVEGDCYASLVTTIPKGKFFEEKTDVYIGCFLDGITKGGLITQANINLEQYNLHPKIKSSLDLYVQTDIVNQLIKDRLLIKGQWFHVDQEPSPFETMKDLVAIIGNGNYDHGVKRIMDRSVGSFDSIPENWLVGLHFQTKKGTNEFQLFKVYQKHGLDPYVIQPDAESKIRAIIDRFEKVEAIVGEKMSETSFHQRNSTRADYSILKTKNLNFFGVGAIGSEIADSTAKAGVGKLELFDNQVIKAQNAVRHLAGLNYIGQPKVAAVAEIIYNHNPYVKILLNGGDLYSLETDKLTEESISISSVADDNVEGYINQQLVLANKVCFYVRALRGGKVARIFRVKPGEDACFHCLSMHRIDGNLFTEIPDDPDYPTLRNECNNPIRPASAADLKFIAALASKLIIDYLQTGGTETNHWVWSSEVIKKTKIKKANILYESYLPPHKDCPYCSHGKDCDVTIKKGSVSFMQGLISENPTIETGGVLAGVVNKDGNITITGASGPGPKAVQSSTKFEKDVEYCQNFLDELYKKSNGKTVYVGEWHSHPSSNNNPSGTDIKSLTEIGLQKDYLTECPVMIIFSNTGVPSCTLHPVNKRFYHTPLKII